MSAEPPEPERPRRIVGVLPDVTGVDRIFSYEVPEALDALVAIGSVVRIPLASRKVRGWVVEEVEEEEPELGLRPIEAFVSIGPTPDVVALARFGAWRYAGRLRSLLVAASPDTVVKRLPAHRSATGSGTPLGDGGAVGELVAAALDAAPPGPRPSLLRLPPGSPRLDVALAALAWLRARGRGGSLLVLVPEHRDANRLLGLLRERRVDAAGFPEDWALAASGAEVVVGSRNATFASLSDTGAVLVLDAHDEAFVSERAPTWRAPVLAAERAFEQGVPCLLVSPTPTLDLSERAEVLVAPRDLEYGGWPNLEVLDRRGDDPRSGLFAPPLVELVRTARAAEPGRPVVAVLNRAGRARLLACTACGELVTCERCDAALAERAAGEGSPPTLTCPRCGLARPPICAACNSTRLRTLRIGVGRAAEEFGALIGEAAFEVSAAAPAPPPGTGLLVGTEAVLHRVRAASLVVFLDFDQELAAPRLRAAEHALSLLGRAARLVGPRHPRSTGFRRRLVVQTRQPDHLVLRSALAGDPDVLALAERARRRELALPPYCALAVIDGDGAAELAAELRPGRHVEVAELGSDRFLLRAPEAAMLAEALSEHGAAHRPLRVEMDPERL